MRLKNLVTSAVLASALVSVPAQAAADRIASDVGGESQIEPSSATYIIGFLALLAVGLGIYFATDDDSPASP
jgi:hypothetical protein